MLVKRKVIDQMERCYCVGTMTVNGNVMLYAASEARGGKFCLYPASGEGKKDTVWEQGGGTMTVVPVPGEKDTLFAVRNFFPGFDAAAAEVVCCRKKDENWEITQVLQLPYLHRFDIFDSENGRVFLGSTLCTSKKEREDWSDPGKVYVGLIGNDVEAQLNLSILADGLNKNHGYWRGEYQGRQAGYLACEKGVYVFSPEKEPGHYLWKRIWDIPSSEAALYDLDGCGRPELISIEPFHGNRLCIYKLKDESYSLIYTYPYPMEFAHALWTGNLWGKPAVLCGCRRGEKDLFIVSYENGGFCTELLNRGTGSANVCVFTVDGCQCVLSADHAKGEVAVYTKENQEQSDNR